MVVIIAVLATVTVAVFNGAQNRAYDATVKSDLRVLTKKLELWRLASSTDSFPTNNTTIATAIPDARVSKNAYSVSPSVSYNLLLCWTNLSSPTSYTLLAVSKSGKQFYITSAGVLSEYTGGTAWSNTDPTAICGIVVPGSSASGAGYSASDTTTGPWRSWTGA